MSNYHGFPDYRNPANGYDQHQYPPLNSKYNPYRTAIRRNVNIASLGMLLFFLLAYFVLPIIASIILTLIPEEVRIEAYPVLSRAISICSTVIAFAVPIIVIAAMTGIPFKAACPVKQPRASMLIPAIFFGFGVSVVAMFVTQLITVFFQVLFNLTPGMPDMTAPRALPEAVLYIISMTFVPALFEELLFRGVIMQSLRRYGDGFALVVSALLFSFAHGNLLQGPNAFMLGLVIGYFVLRTGSILTGMIMHFVNNAVVVAVEYLTYFLPAEMGEMLNLYVLLAWIVLGVVGLIWLLVAHPNMFRLVPANDSVSSGRKCLWASTSVAFILYFLSVLIITALSFE